MFSPTSFNPVSFSPTSWAGLGFPVLTATAWFLMRRRRRM